MPRRGGRVTGARTPGRRPWVPTSVSRRCGASVALRRPRSQGGTVERLVPAPVRAHPRLQPGAAAGVRCGRRTAAGRVPADAGGRRSARRRSGSTTWPRTASASCSTRAAARSGSRRRGARPARARRREADRRGDLRDGSRRSRVAAFVVGGRLMVADLRDGAARELAPAGPAVRSAPRPHRAPGGLRRRRGAARDRPRRRAWTVELVHDDDPDVHWGLAEFVAAEEMGRHRAATGGRPTATGSSAARVDERALPRLAHRVADRSGRGAAGRPLPADRDGRTPSSRSTCSVSTARVVDVEWDRDAFEYVAAVSWTAEGPPLALVQSRDQRDVQVLGDRSRSRAPPRSCGPTTTTRGRSWSPASRPGSRAAGSSRPAHRGDTRRLLIDGEPVTPEASRWWPSSTPGEDGGVPRHRRIHRGARVAAGSRRRSARGSATDPGVHAAGGGRRPPRAGVRDDRDSAPGRRPARDGDRRSTPSTDPRRRRSSPPRRPSCRWDRGSSGPRCSRPAGWNRRSRCPSCSIRTGDRATAACCAPSARFWSRSGSPIRGSS